MPPSALYRLKTFIRRNRGAVFSAGLVVLALVVGVVGTTVGYIRAEKARGEAALELENTRRALADLTAETKVT